jgi:hypothetical protein
MPDVIFNYKMNIKRVFKTKSFDRWAKKLIEDKLLCIAAQEIAQGLFEADLGGGVCKKRIALPGSGKRGSTRTLVAKRHETAIFFLAGREKNSPTKDFSATEEEAAKIIAKSLENATFSQLEQMKQDGILKEICHEKSH